MQERTLGLLISTALLLLSGQMASAESYTVIGPDESGNINSLDFDSIKRFGPYVDFTVRSIYNHDPKWDVPKKHHLYIGRYVGNCDNETIASYSWQILDPTGAVVGHGETPPSRLQFSHDPESETLMLKISCSRVKLLPLVAPATGENALKPAHSNGQADTPAQNSNVSPSTEAPSRVTTGQGYTEYHDKGVSAQIDTTGKGAVICMWSIYNALIEVGSECFKNSDDIQKELAISAQRTDSFIIKNSSHAVTQSQLDAKRAESADQMRKDSNICRGQAAAIYQRVRSGGAASLHASTDELLSVPREPVMNPCL